MGSEPGSDPIQGSAIGKRTITQIGAVATVGLVVGRLIDVTPAAIGKGH